MRIGSAALHRRSSKHPPGRLQRALTRTRTARRRPHRNPIARFAERVTAMRRRATHRGAKPPESIGPPDTHRRPRDVVASAAHRLTTRGR
jgi:hypothetical protein